VIHVVDDDESFQSAISRLLRATGYKVRTYANAGDFLLADLDEAPGCILLDVRMPGPSGLELQAALAMRPAPLPIIFLSGYGDIPTTVRAIKAGAVDFLTKPVKREALLNAIRNALAHDAERRVLREQWNRWRACYDSLTQRELQVFEGVVNGKMNKEIADHLGTAVRTVKAHRGKMMEKMRVHSVAELVHIADQLRRLKNPSSSGQIAAPMDVLTASC
jgi:FixJ family two-component response regulator